MGDKKKIIVLRRKKVEGFLIGEEIFIDGKRYVQVGDYLFFPRDMEDSWYEDNIEDAIKSLASMQEKNE